MPRQRLFVLEEYHIVIGKLKRFFNYGIIEVSDGKSDDKHTCTCIWNISFQSREDDRVSLILNPKLLNSLYVEKSHFKMLSLVSAINAMRKDSYFASVNLSDAYYSFRVGLEIFQIYL